MNISLIDLKPLSVSLTQYMPYVSLIDLNTQTITIQKTFNTAYQAFINKTQITINKELDKPISVSYKIP